jgi:hypothetical protein
MGKRVCVLLVAMMAPMVGLSAQGSASQKIAIIGCLQGNAQKVFTLKDFRSGRTYRIDADAESIGWHVGHELEIHGAVTSGSDGLRLKADQVIFIANKCSS